MESIKKDETEGKNTSSFHNMQEKKAVSGYFSEKNIVGNKRIVSRDR